MDVFYIENPHTDPIRAFAKIHHLPYALLLDSADRRHPDARYSYILCNPLETIEAKDDEIMVSSRSKLMTLRGKDPFDVARQRMENMDFSTKAIKGLPPFQGGIAGLFSYDLGRTLEDMPGWAISNPDMPDMALGLYDQVIAYDHKLEKSWVITHARNQFEAQMKQAVLLNNLEGGPMLPEPLEEPIYWNPQFKPAAYKQRIEQVINYIRAGDIFQANLSQRFEAMLPVDFDPFSHYQVLRQVNSAPFASYMNLGPVKISSASPERFLRTDLQRRCQSKPIKGSAPRLKDKTEDFLSMQRLQTDKKNRAENIMITDLLRNDLSRVCAPESIQVDELCSVESFAGIHHLVSTVSGILDKGKHALDLLRACFPGGSITGAPKIRAMEVIEELEPTRRGPYCGSIAMVGFNGFMDSSILIRTLVYDHDSVSFNVGGGITALSNADDEYQETMDKAHLIFESFQSEETPTKIPA